MNKKKILLIITVIVVALVIAFVIWLFVPKTFLRGVEVSDVKYISVIDGDTGSSFDISDESSIQYILENIQNTKTEIDGISIGRSGYSFRLCFYDYDGREIETLIINSSDTIRKDPFFYSCSGGLCYDYLNELEH